MGETGKTPSYEGRKINEEHKMNDTRNESDCRLDNLIDTYLASEMDDGSFAFAVILGQIEKKISPNKPVGHIGLIIGYISDKILTPKVKQQVKEKLAEIRKACNTPGISDTEKERIIDELGDLLQLIELK